MLIGKQGFGWWFSGSRDMSSPPAIGLGFWKVTLYQFYPRFKFKFMPLCLRLTDGHMINLHEHNPEWSYVDWLKQISLLSVGMVTLTA